MKGLLSLNVDKTKFIALHLQVDYPKLKMNGIKIERLIKFNFLGLIVSGNIKWQCHIEIILHVMYQDL